MSNSIQESIFADVQTTKIGQVNPTLFKRHSRSCPNRAKLFIPLMVIAMSLTGCGEKTEGPTTKNSQNSESRGTGNSDPTDPFAIFDGNSQGSNLNNPAGDSTNSNGQWTIVLATFNDSLAHENAIQIRQEFTQMSGMAGAQITVQGERSILHYGSYLTLDNSAYKYDINKIKAMQVGDAQPFRGAFPSILNPSEIGSMPQYELTRLWDRYPQASVIYSLQIGVYDFDHGDDSSRKEARKAAEQYVTRLRSEGDPAFYYHGPTMSVVTVGTFFEHSVDAVLGVGPEVKRMQQRHPYNTANGREIIETKITTTGQRRKVVQPSMLVNVPRQ